MAPSKKRKAAAIAEAEPAAVATPPSKRGRGRPSKAEKAENEPTQAVATPPVKRGRPTKATNSAISNSGLVQNNNPTPSKASNKGQAAKANTSLRRSSRHPSGADTVANPETAAIASRVTRGSNAAATNGTVVAVKGTKAKGKAKAASSSKAGAGATKVSTRGLAKKKPVAGKGKAAATTELNGNDKDSPSNNEDLPTVEQPTKRRGRKAQVSVNVSSRIGAAEEAEDADEEDVDQPNYWLMKAEPESRIEKGKDVKFSIDDLKNAFEPEGWDGTSSALEVSFPSPPQPLAPNISRAVERWILCELQLPTFRGLGFDWNTNGSLNLVFFRVGKSAAHLSWHSIYPMQENSELES